MGVCVCGGGALEPSHLINSADLAAASVSISIPEPDLRRSRAGIIPALHIFAELVNTCLY